MVLFNDIATLAERLAVEPGRLKKRAAIADALAAIHAASPQTPDAGLFCIYLAGQPFAEADARKLNAGGALLSRAVKTVSACTDASLTAAYRRHGDLGAAAHDVLLTKAVTTASLTLSEVADAFAALASARTTAARAAIVEGLLRQSTALDAKYLLKLMLGDMRIGVKQSLIEEAIAVAASADVAAVRHAVMLEADLAHTVQRAFTGTLSEARMTLFHPLGFMLASPVETPEEAVERFTAPPPKPEKPAKKPRRKKGAPSESADAGTGFSDASELDILSPATQSSPPELDEVESSEEIPVTNAAASGATAIDAIAFLEDKYDGMRAQLHCGDAAQPGRVAIYSRNREDITQSFPEIFEGFRHVSTPLILDGELLGWDATVNRALPFAILGQRIGRKRVDTALRRSVPAVFMAFDILFEGDQLLLALPLHARRARLEAIVADLSPQTFAPFDEPLAPKGPQAQHSLFAEHHADSEEDLHLGAPSSASQSDSGAMAKVGRPQTLRRLLLSPSIAVTTAEQIDLAYADARARSNEGVMIKAAGSAYLPGRRGLAWVKLKRELATLDVVITGAEFGSGRRAPFLSDYTFAVRDEAGELLNVGKAYSGVTDAEIVELTEWLKAHTLEDHGHFRTVEPQIVLEVAFNNIMRSTRHASGFALRFPRILHIRRDKPASEIDTLHRVEEIYQSQPDKPAE